MTLATSQGNQPSLARLPTGLPRTQAEWTQFVNALQAWQRGVQSVIWQTPTLQNSWEFFGSPHEPPGFYMDATGGVHLRGLVKGGTLGVGNPIFTLPVGYRPPYAVVEVGISNDALCEIDISTAGAVYVGNGGSSTWVSLSGISFSTQ